MTIEQANMQAVDFFLESLKAARYSDYGTIINDGNAYSQHWKQRLQQLQTLNAMLHTWMSSVLPFMTTLPPEMLSCLQGFFEQWLIFPTFREDGFTSSVLCGYYACECMILLATGPIGKIREFADVILVPLARRLTELTWQSVVEEQKYFAFSNLRLPSVNKLGITERNFLAQDALLLFENAKQVGENMRVTLEELFTPQ